MKRRDIDLINRRNWQDTRHYLAYYQDVLQNKVGSVDFCRISLDHLLRWATSSPFSRAPEIRPTYPAHLVNLQKSPEYERKLLNNARSFFAWSRERWPDRYAILGREYLDSLRSKRKAGVVKLRELYTLDHVRVILAYPPASRVERRDQAAVAFLFLSGMRVGAFATLPVRAVHLDKRPPMINQWTALGVRTKNDDVANTFLLDNDDLADLHQIVRIWDAEARAGVGETGMWFAVIERDGETFAPDQTPGDHRGDGVARRIKRLCELANVDYLSPHKLRHGHIVYAADRCETIADFKAISQNVMHKQLSTTDAIYSRLAEDDVAKRIQQLGKRTSLNDGQLDELAEALFSRITRTK
jgi:integrase